MATEEAGNIEIKFSDRAEANPVTVWAAHTSQISAGAKAYPSGANLEALEKFSTNLVNNVGVRGRVLVFFTSDATDIIESEESAAQLPIILYDEATGQPVTRKVLTFENMTGFTAAGTVDITCTAGVPQRVAYYDIPNGFYAMLDYEGKPHIYMGDDSA